ncbi:hypothetical protein B0I35DRAFT_412507 [Stachybotrys elegans]|uniref:Uncharacterized protein n=1 Tax=Stachybotrys elegans TaxID=80388 RepID=A0A8K0SJ93_9HYPO|nr:hypothetical protein B0I35DRAFT_412507 [Stachybotrys elegans]
MEWGVRTGGTAKISAEVRWILADKVDAILHKLKYLRQRAVAYASPEAILLLAVETPLPNPSTKEMEDLKDPSTESNISFLPQLPNSTGPPFIELVIGAETTDTAYCLEDSWFKYMDEAPGDPDVAQIFTPSWSVTEISPEDGNGLVLGDCCAKGPCGDCMQLDEISPEESSSDEDDHPLQRTKERWARFASQSQDACASLHPLLTPWCDSFPIRLEEYLDHLDTATFKDIHENFALPDGTIHKDTARELLEYLRGSPTPAYPVSAEQLIELQQYIQQVMRFRSYLIKSLTEVTNALNRREDRYRMISTSGDITMVMRSRGDGSPLVEGISVDEDWPEDWGASWAKMPRRKIFGTTPTWLASLERTSFCIVPREDPNKKSMSKIHW